MIGAEDESQRDGGDRYLADGSDEEGLDSLLEQVLEAGTQADSGEGKQERPAAEVAQSGDLRSAEAIVNQAGELRVELGVECAECGQERDDEEAENKLGELLPEECALVLDRPRLSLARPVDGLTEDDEADAGVAARLGKYSEFSGGIGVEGSGGGGFGGVVDGETGPETVGVVGHVQGMADEGKEDQRDGTQGKDGGDGDGGVLFVGIDGALRGDDGGDAADAGADSEERNQLGRELEAASKIGHERERQGKLDEDEDEGDAAEVEDIAEDETRTEKDDSGLEPKVVGGDSSAEDSRQAEGIGDEDADEDRPEDVLDVGQDQVMGLAVAGDGLLYPLAGVADGGEQGNAGNEAEDAMLTVFFAVSLTFQRGRQCFQGFHECLLS